MNTLRALIANRFDIRRFTGVFALMLMVALGAANGAFRPLDHWIEEVTFTLSDRQASKQIHVIEMDAASMAAIQSWPWPRDHYTRLIQQLDASGVRSISFDVDLSGSSPDPAVDRALGEAIASANAPVALPTFAQQAGFREGRQLDTLPAAALREHALLASVSIAPDSDGFVRRMPLGMITAGSARPSIAALVAGRAGAVNQSFPIDYAINPSSLPRHSFIAIERGEFDRDALEGKDVIIGATAIELGDRYPVPRHGVIHGVIVQAIGAETLLNGVPVYGSWQAPLFAATLLALLIVTARQRRRVAVRFVLAAGGIILAWLAARLVTAIWFEVVPALLLLALSAGLRFVVLTRSESERQRRIDPESGLPNRRALNSRDGREGERYFLAARIDEFDALKQAVGEDNIGGLLRRLTERLQVAGSAGTVYRLDTGTLVWSSPLELADLEPLLAGLRAVMRSPFEVAGRRLGVSLAFGVAEADTADAPANAAHAANLAKRAGNPWRLYTADEGETAAQRFSLLGELDDALRDGQISVVYQPKLELATDRISAVEALVRWNHPVRGMLPPDMFIPLIEENNRIDDLTLAVLAKALGDMRDWSVRGLIIDVAVNISAGLLTSQSFASRALALVDRLGVPPDHLTFEVTESAQFEDTDRAIAMLERFRAHGIRISMDDYGTGQSTLNYLKLLPVSELKIDRMFVQHAHVDPSDAMLVRSTVQLAHELGLKVVAEGIEEADCLAFLRRIGCDYVQGYFISRPLSADDLAEKVSTPVAKAA